MERRSVGKLLFFVVTIAYLYYSFWVLVTPFIDLDQPILRFFPDKYFAIAVPVLAGVVLWSVTLITLGSFLVGSELRKSRAVRKQKSS